MSTGGKWRWSIGLLAVLALAGSLFWVFYYRQILEIRGLAIGPVDLGRVPDGSHLGSFDTPYKTYRVAVQVEKQAIRRVEVTPSDDFMGHYDRQGMAVAQRVVSRQNLGVDAVSGATVTSKAVLKAIEKALTGSARNRS